MVLLLGQDERHAGAVGAQGRGLLAAAAVEHGQRRQRRSHAAVPGHGPQLLAVVLDGVVVVQLDPERQHSRARRGSVQGHTLHCCTSVSNLTQTPKEESSSGRADCRTMTSLPKPCGQVRIRHDSSSESYEICCHLLRTRTRREHLVDLDQMD